MAKFKVGDKVRLTIKNKMFLSKFNDSDICKITGTNCGGKKSYHIERLQDGLGGYAMEDELELIGDILKIGDTVQPQTFCIGYPDYFEIVGIHNDNKYDLKQLTFYGRTLKGMELLEWEQIDFNAVPSISHPMDIVTQQVLTDIKGENPYKMYVEGKFENAIEKGEDKMKILEIYSRKANSIIEDKYDKLEKEVRENDVIYKIIQDASNQINVLLDRDEKNAINLVPTGIYSELLEPKSSEKIVELKLEREREERNVEKLIEEVKARLEICDNDEISKVEVLKKYGILTSEEKIAEYKIEKKGKK